MFIKSDGNVGISTTNPAARLDVGVNSGHILLGDSGCNPGFNGIGFGSSLFGCTNYSLLGNGTDTFVNRTTGGSIEFREANATQMTIRPGGNVGIGQNNPGARLDVAGNINTSTQYNIGGNRVLSVSGNNVSPNSNTFAGINAGASNSTGVSNSFFGQAAGSANNAASDNSFFGFHAGNVTTFGNNSFFGSQAGAANTNGASNSYFGGSAGNTATNGNSNSLFGAFTDSSNGLSNATALGAKAFVGRSNSLVLGSITGVNGALTDTYVGIGTTAPTSKLMVTGDGAFNAAGAARFDLFNTTANVGFFQHVLDDGRWQLGTGSTTRLLVNTAGNLGIGTIDPGTRLHVLASVVDADGVPTPGEHVALIENTKVGRGQAVLALRVGDSDPIATDNFITFYNSNSNSIGAIEGNGGSSSVSLVGPGNDYAEWLPRRNPAEKIQPGDIVGLYGGQITKQTRGAAQVMAISTGPIVSGNDPGKVSRGGYERVAFIGQVMARVRGTVRAGDFIVASGMNDGTGVAVSPERITSDQFEQVLGQAWEASDDPNVKSVRVAVGLLRHDPTVGRLLAYSRQQAAMIAAMEARLNNFEARAHGKSGARKFTASRKSRAAVATASLLFPRQPRVRH
ncbi:MAG TPA: hypothetical protein VGN95_04970 [Pyrinomonadaceae bacterium]|nr:hypothetical protein [Pyrinomonadaceae bacterium]